MPSGDGSWAELSSQNERVVMRGDQDWSPVLPAQSEWAGLASTGERLIEASDPLFELTGRSRASTGMRLVTGAA